MQVISGPSPLTYCSGKEHSVCGLPSLSHGPEQNTRWLYSLGYGPEEGWTRHLPPEDDQELLEMWESAGGCKW